MTLRARARAAQDELKKLLFPVMVHCYLDLVEKGYHEQGATAGGAVAARGVDGADSCDAFAMAAAAAALRGRRPAAAFLQKHNTDLHAMHAEDLAQVVRAAQGDARARAR